MLNLFLGLVLTSAIGIADISGNDVLEDNPIMLTSQVPSDATNQDIVDSINANTDILSTLVEPSYVEKTINFPYTFSINAPNVPYLGVSSGKVAYITSNEYSCHFSFKMSIGESFSVKLPNYCNVFYSTSDDVGEIAV